jgi:cbb3-type cytochrome oxidase subunit 3
LLYRIRILRVCFIYNEKCKNVFAYSFFIIQLFLFLSFSTSYIIWSWKNPFAYSFFHIQLFLFFLCFLFILYMKLKKSICLFIFLHSAISFFFPFLLCIFIYNMKLNKSICLFVFLHSAISFSSSSFSYYIWSWQNPFAYSFSHIHLFLFSFLSFFAFSYIIWSWINLFAYSFSCVQLFLFPLVHFHIIYEVKIIYLLIHFLAFSYFFFLYPGRKIGYQDLIRIVRLIISDLTRSDENRTKNRRLWFLTPSRIKRFLQDSVM